MRSWFRKCVVLAKLHCFQKKNVNFQNEKKIIAYSNVEKGDNDLYEKPPVFHLENR